MLRVLPYILGFDKALDYSLPDFLADSPGAIKRGSIVQVPVKGRPVRGWVLDTDPEPEPGIRLQPVQKHLGIGPSEEVLDLADWASRRWLGRRAMFYNLASPPRQVRRLPQPLAEDAQPMKKAAEGGNCFGKKTGEFAKVIRLAPSSRIWPIVKTALEETPALILFPDEDRAKKLVRHARSQGFPCALWPDQWERAASGGCSVVGNRSAVFATMPEVRSVLMIDEHSESYHETWQSATWHAREIARERARKLAVPFVMTSPVPTLNALKDAELITQSRKSERDGWVELTLVDLREREHVGLFSHQLIDHLRGVSRAVCVVKRAGVSVARRQLARLLREPVGKITARETDQESARVLIGTTAALRRVGRCDLVAFLEFDMLLASPHYRAEETALALLAEAARLAGSKADEGHLLVQTRHPEHPVLRAAAEASPEIFSEHDRQIRQDLRLPPFAAVAKVTGEEAEMFIKTLQLGQKELLTMDAPSDIEIMGPDQDGAWLVRAADHETLCSLMLSVSEIPESVRISIDPPRI